MSHRFPFPAAPSWLVLGTLAFLMATLLAVVLVVSRMPFPGELLANEQLFRTTLVLHVNMAVLIWFGAFVGYLWSESRDSWGRWSLVPVGLGSGGALLLLVAATLPAEPILSNYVPVIDHPLFLLGLKLFVASLVLQGGLWCLANLHCCHRRFSALDICLLSIYLLLLLSLITVAAAAWRLPGELPPELFYELLFWGGGHVAQVLYAQLLIAIWLRLLGDSAPAGSVMFIVLLVPVAAVLLSLWPAFTVDPRDAGYRDYFTQLMRWGSWLAVPYVAWHLWRQRARFNSILKVVFAGSLTLFVLGLLVGSMIRGDNLMVPAHYHATTGAINLALMGLSYAWVQRAGVITLWSMHQLRLYAVGVMMMVMGLALSGYMGVSRKVTAKGHLLDGWSEQMAMTLMGVGGLTAIGAVFLFVGILFLLLRNKTSLLKSLDRRVKG
ncbi:hypothetical protein [Aestuariirhabdus sp. LZHN29]|uniref:hypothetical protein n=1 Tax=Aestuariirhabdus sp. LZHN29 TaxID=3417462 RepID=UPI003CEDAAEA